MSAKKKQNLNYARNMDIDHWRDRQVCKRLAAQQEREERDFILAHGRDSDEELTEYVLKKARRLGRMPDPLELPGGRYLMRRLGDWSALALRLGYTPVSQKKGIAVYRRIKEQTEEDFLRERRALKAAKKLDRIARDKEKNRIQATRERGERQKAEALEAPQD